MNEHAPAMHWSRLLSRLWSCLSRRRQHQFVRLMFLVAFSACAEIFTLGAVLPFLGILIAPEKVFRRPAIAHLVRHLGISSPNELVLPLTVLFASAALLTAMVRILLLWASTRLAYAVGSDIGIDVYRRALYRPYEVQVTLNSSEVISGITGKVNETMQVLNQIFLLISSFVLLVVIGGVLIAIEPLVALIAIAVLGSAYMVISRTYRRRLYRNSDRIAVENTQVIKAVQEGLGGIRDVLLDGTQPVYCEIHRRADRNLRRAQASNLFISGSPRFLMEALGMVLIAGLAYGLSREAGSVTDTIPILGTLALGAQRLLPALQQGYSAWAIISGSYSSVDGVVEMLRQPLPSEALEPPPEPIRLRRRIRFNHVSFRYTSDGPTVLNDIDLGIEKGSRVGIVGSTGSGKTTLADVLMGLLKPTSGEILLDGDSITGSRVRAWQRSIAHVPQSIFLADTTMAENIALGIPPIDISQERLRQAAQQAQIAAFIETLPAAYDTVVGERGIRLSGGQRQRIGIARALYKQADVLVFDEATSALDNATEQSVLEAIEGLDRDLTIILIAHRLTTVRHCDCIVELDRGQLIDQGSYDHLMAHSPSFRRMAALAVA